MVHFLTFFLMFDPQTQFQLAIELNQNKQYQESEAIFSFISPKTVSLEQYHYRRLLNNFMLNNKKQADIHARQLEGFDVYRLPWRHQVLTNLMIDDLKTWKKNDLKEAARKMEDSQNRLTQGKKGPQTQKVQKEIVDILDNLINDLEKKKEEQNQKSQQQGQDSQKQDSSGQGKPQDDSKPGDDSGPGKVDVKRIQEMTQTWGKLPAKDREANIRELTRNMPPRYKDLIMEYFRKMSVQETEKRR